MIMELKDVMMKRRSVRRFTEEPVSAEQIETLLHHAMSGPSACNARPWEFYIVTRTETLEALRKAGRFTSYVSPLMIVVAGNMKKALPMQLRDFWVQDCSAAMENLLLSAVDLGLGACWEGLYPMKRMVQRVSAILGLEEHIVPLGMAAIGHPAEDPEPRDQYDPKRVHRIE
jgi:nitroreductase